MTKKKRSFEKGCWICKHLDYYEAYFEESSNCGYMCNYRDSDEIEKFKKFPCERKLKCFESGHKQNG
jgi:hypothetical protein